MALREIARGDDPGSTLSLLLLEVSQLVLAGGRLGAISDVVPDERVRAGRRTRPRRRRAAASDWPRLLGPVDDYVEVVDPVDPDRGADGVYRLSDDLAEHRRRPAARAAHYRDGRHRRGAVVVAVLLPVLWGNHAAAALRALHSLIAHTRLDAELDPETQAEQELLVDVAAEAVER